MHGPGGPRDYVPGTAIRGPGELRCGLAPASCPGCGAVQHAGGHLVTAPTTAGPSVHRPALIFVHGSPRIGGSGFALWIQAHPYQPAHAHNGGINSIVGASVWNEAASTIASNPENTNLIEPVPEPMHTSVNPCLLYILWKGRDAGSECLRH